MCSFEYRCFRNSIKLPIHILEAELFEAQPYAEAPYQFSIPEDSGLPKTIIVLRYQQGAFHKLRSSAAGNLISRETSDENAVLYCAAEILLHHEVS